MYLRKRGEKWEYSFEIAQANGRRQRFSKGGFKTKKDAQAAGQKAELEYNNSGQSFTPSEMSVEDYMQFWLDSYCKVNLKQTTLESYKKKIRLYIQPDLGKYRLKSITPAVIQDLINKLFNQGLSRNTLTCIKGIMNHAFGYAVEPCGYIATNPALYVKLPLKRAVPEIKPSQKQRRAVTDDEWGKIIKRFPEGHVAHIPLILGYRCGMRLGEVFGTMWSDIDLEKGTLKICRQVQNISKSTWELVDCKYGSSRTIYLDPQTIALLKREKNKQRLSRVKYGQYYTFNRANTENQIGNDGELIDMLCIRENGEWTNPRIMQHVSRVIHGKTQTTELISEEWDFHSLRHTHATKLVEAGVPYPTIQERLGHSRIQVTEIYTHHTESMDTVLRDALQNLN